MKKKGCQQVMLKSSTPKCSEVFDSYLCIGFRADDAGLLVLGDPGKYWNIRRDKLRECAKKAK